MKTNWSEVPLMDVCNPKQWPTISQSVFTPKGYPVFGANGRIGFFSEFNHENPTILITCRGATCGNINVCDPQSYVTGNAMALDDLDESRTNFRFLYHALRHRGLNRAITGTAQPQITRQSLAGITIPQPYFDDPVRSIREQQRIADILDKADALRRNSQQQLVELENLVTSLFREMIGVPGERNTLWEKRPVAKVASVVAGNAWKSSDFTDSPQDGPPVIRIQNLGDNEHARLKHYSGTVDDKYWIDPDEILVSLSGSFKAHRWDGPRALLNQRIVVIRPHNSADTEFVFTQISMLLSQIVAQAQGVAVLNASMGTVRDMLLAWPGQNVRDDFTAALLKLKSIKRRAIDSERDSKDLFDTLVQRGFRGDL